MIRNERDLWGSNFQDIKISDIENEMFDKKSMTCHGSNLVCTSKSNNQAHRLAAKAKKTTRKAKPSVRVP